MAGEGPFGWNFSWLLLGTYWGGMALGFLCSQCVCDFMPCVSEIVLSDILCPGNPDLCRVICGGLPL